MGVSRAGKLKAVAGCKPASAQAKRVPQIQEVVKYRIVNPHITLRITF
jgi:hypothetical protein